MDNKLFNSLFEGAKSNGKERIEDFTTELLGFMWEVDPEFKKEFLSIIGEKVNKRLEPLKCELLTQESVSRNGKLFTYDLVIKVMGEASDTWIVIENKIGNPENQFTKYEENKEEGEF